MQVFHIVGAGKCYFVKHLPAGPDRAGEGMPKKRSGKKVFSAVKAVKANARERVGQPKPQRVLPARPREEGRSRKYPKTIRELLSEEH